MNFIAFLRTALAFVKRLIKNDVAYRKRHPYEPAKAPVAMSEQQLVLAELLYPVAHSETETIEGIQIMIAESSLIRESGSARQHRRLISNQRLSVNYGRPLVYVDSYTSAKGYETYVYARHKCNPESFLVELDLFLADFPELVGRQFKCVLNVGGEFSTKYVTCPFLEVLRTESSQIEFMKFSIPFGDISVEFAKEPIMSPYELSYLRDRVLPRRLESPLFAFDSSSEALWAPFLASIHWANEQISPSVLRHLIEEAAATPVTQ